MSTKEKRIYVKSGKYSADPKEERRKVRESKKLLMVVQQGKTRRKRAEKIETARKAPISKRILAAWTFLVLCLLSN